MTKKISYYLFIYIFSIVVYLFLNIYNLNNNLMKNTEYFLKNVAKSLSFVIREDYLLYWSYAVCWTRATWISKNSG